MRKHKILLTIIFSVVLIIVFYITRIYTANRDSQRPYHTIMELHGIRKNIDVFLERENRYPNSLAELKKYVRKNQNEELIDGRWMEVTSSKEGNGNEYSILNNKGGWYYNCETGEVRVNLTKPLKNYLKFYFKGDRNQIPSEW